MTSDRGEAGEADEAGGTLMWEVRAEPGRLDELIVFVRTSADEAAQIYRADGADPRVVVIDPSGRGLPEPPAGLAARPQHVWRFTPVPR